MNSPGDRKLRSERFSTQAFMWRLIVLRMFMLFTFVVYALGFGASPTVLSYLAAICIFSMGFSFASWRYFKKAESQSAGALSLQLVWDSFIILCFVWLAGRSTNPFIYYQLLVIAISASILPEKFTVFFTALAIAAYSLVMYLDLGHHMSHMDSSFKAHLLGMWVNFTGSAVLIAFFISRLSSALTKRDDLLRLAREENLKNEQIIGIGTLAASTMHSFGTPLSTISMAVSELDSLHEDEQSRACTSMIQAQIQRCKKTMKKLAALTARKEMNERRISTVDLADEIKEYLQLINASPMPSIELHACVSGKLLPGGLLLLHAVINLIDNAVEAANSYVTVTFTQENSADTMMITIKDDGHGLLKGSAKATKKPSAARAEGLGIGLLLVNSTIERLGGTVTYNNPTPSETSTRITIELPCIE